MHVLNNIYLEQLMKQAKILTKAEYRRVMHVIDAHRYAVRNKTTYTGEKFGLVNCLVTS